MVQATGQVVNAVFDTSGNVVNYSTNAAGQVNCSAWIPQTTLK